jgi:hypothetical protein
MRWSRYAAARAVKRSAAALAPTVLPAYSDAVRASHRAVSAPKGAAVSSTPDVARVAAIATAAAATTMTVKKIRCRPSNLGFAMVTDRVSSLSNTWFATMSPLFVTRCVRVLSCGDTVAE